MGNKNLNERGQQLSNSLMNTGHIVDSKRAAASLDKYFEISGKSPDDPDHVYGFVYGLNSVRDLLANIDKANEKTTDPTRKIVGLRFLKAFTKRENPDFKLKTDDYYEDLLVTPVYATGENYLKSATAVAERAGSEGEGEGEGEGEEEDILLAGSRPCPNQCG